MGFDAVLNREMITGQQEQQQTFERLRRDIDWLQRALTLSPGNKTLQEEWSWKSREYDNLAYKMGFTRVEGDL
tara:strand:- start:258 stop:476 length:219 start_codon:yes stop_codon:yes gene_type:complete